MSQVQRDRIPGHIEVAKGTKLQASRPDNELVVLTVIAFDEETVTLDGNHPLAGEDLTFEIELVTIG